MKDHSRIPSGALYVLLVAFVLLAVGFSVAVPLGEAPDEVSHLAYVRYLIAHRQLPRPEGPVAGEAHQPPFYYLIGALSTAWVPSDDWQVIANPDYAPGDPQAPNLLAHTRSEAFPYQGTPLAWHLVRLLSVIMGAITVWATYRIGLILSDGDSWIALAAAAMVAFLPEFTFISGMVNNDNLVVMLSSLAVLQVLTLNNAQFPARSSVVLGMLLGLALLTKLSGLVLWPFALLLLMFQAYRSRRWHTGVYHMALVFGTAILIGLPWAIFNLLRFGDPLGWAQVIAITPIREAPMTLENWLGVGKGLFTSFAGRFGGALQLTLPDAYYWLFALALILAMVGWLARAGDLRAGKSDPSALTTLSVFAFFWVLLLAAYIRWTLTALGTDQARQLFPGISLLAIFITLGAARLVPGGAKRTAAALAITGACVTVAVLVYLHLIYALPVEFSRLDTAPSPSDFGQTIRVLDYQINGERVLPGNPVRVQIEWQALRMSRQDYWLQLQLVGPQGPVADKDGIPSAGRQTTDWWEKGQTVSSRHSILVPPDAAPGGYKLILGLHPFGRWDWLPVDGHDRMVLGEIHVD